MHWVANDDLVLLPAYIAKDDAQVPGQTGHSIPLAQRQATACYITATVKFSDLGPVRV